MLLLRCTQRLLKGSGISTLADPPAGTLPLGEWYANRIPLPFRGRTAVMYTSSDALLTVVAPGRAVRTTLPVFLERMPALLRRLDLPDAWAERHRVSTGDVAYATTASRRVLGSMNDLANQVWFDVEAYPRWEMIDWDEIEERLSIVPLSLLAYSSPDLVARRLASTGQPVDDSTC